MCFPDAFTSCNHVRESHSKLVLEKLIRIKYRGNTVLALEGQHQNRINLRDFLLFSNRLPIFSVSYDSNSRRYLIPLSLTNFIEPMREFSSKPYPQTADNGVPLPWLWSMVKQFHGLQLGFRVARTKYELAGTIRTRAKKSFSTWLNDIVKFFGSGGNRDLRFDRWGHDQS